jgi:hypothetical protein
MGTSTDHSGGSGGHWRGAKTASTSFAKKGDKRRAERALGRLVQALGGASAVSGASGGAIAAARGLGSLIGTASSEGLDAALGQVGLGELVGRPADEIVAALIDGLAGNGDDQEGQAARAAACDVFEELAKNASSYEDLAKVLADADGIGSILEQFLSSYVYWLLLPVIEERVERLDDSALRAKRERELREVVAAMVELNISKSGFNPARWPQATEADVQALLQETLAYMEAQDY